MNERAELVELRKKGSVFLFSGFPGTGGRLVQRYFDADSLCTCASVGTLVYTLMLQLPQDTAAKEVSGFSCGFSGKCRRMI